MKRMKLMTYSGLPRKRLRSSGFCVAAAIVPQQIRDYVAKNFAGRKIVSIDRDKRDWEVKLDNGLDLKFDLQFRLIEIDD